MVQGYSTVCTFGKARQDAAPFQLVSECPQYTIYLRQKDAAERTRRHYFRLDQSNSPFRFAWDDTLVTRRLAVIVLDKGALRRLRRRAPLPCIFDGGALVINRTESQR